MKKALLNFFIGSVAIVVCQISFGQISIGALPYTPATTNFNSYNPSSAGNLTSTIPTGWSAASTGTALYRGQGTGSTTNAGYWGLGTGGDFSLGAICAGPAGSNPTSITYTVSFVNNSGSTITTVALSWDYEQWIYGTNNSNWDCTGINGLNVAALNALDYTEVTGANGTGTTTSVSVVLTGLSIANGSTFGIQWVTSNQGSNAADNGLSIDNFSIVASRTDNTDYFRSRQSGNWATTTTWQSSKDATTWVNSSLAPDNNANTITILSGHTVTVAASVSIDQATINSGGQISVSSGQTLTIANGAGTDLSVDGTLYNAGTVTTTGTLAFNASSIYEHAQNSGTIPTASWNTSSTCNITGITNTAPSGLGQAFGNFTWNCSGHSTLIQLNSALTTINGDFTVSYAGQANGGGRTQNGLALATNSNLSLNVGGNLNLGHASNDASWLIMAYGTANVTLNVTGNFNMSLTGSGTCFFDFKINTATTIGTLVLNVGGNFNLTGGYFDWTYQTNGGTTNTTMNLTGNFTQSGTGYMITSTGTATITNGKIIFNKAGTQTVSLGNINYVVYTNFQVSSGSTVELLSSLYLQSNANAPWAGQFVVNSGGILDAGTYQILSSTGSTAGSNNGFTLNSGAGIVTANTNGVQNTTLGTISTSIANRTYSSVANYTYDGTALQNSGTFTTTPTLNQVNNLTINNTTGANTTGVTLQQEFKVASVCTFIAGVFTTTNTNILTINDNATIVGVDLDAGSTKYVNGPLKKVGNDVFTFPVGKISHGCRPIYISAPSNVTDEFRAELIRGNAGSLGPITASGLQKVSGCEYWYFDRLVGTSNVNVSLSWSGESPCNAQSYVTDLPNLVVAHFNGTSWDTYGNDGGTTGDAVKGTVTWNYTGPYNTSPTQTPWSLGSLVWWTNPLTVKFIHLQASEKNGQVKVEWANIAETGVDKYFVEYSTDGRNFNSINNTSARTNSGDRADYSLMHLTPANGNVFYRIKAIEFSGDITYSHIVRVIVGGRSNNEFIVYPNPAKSGQVTISTSSLTEGRYDITILNMTGQKIMQRTLNHAGGSLSTEISLPENIRSGSYLIRLSGNGQDLIKTFLVH